MQTEHVCTAWREGNKLVFSCPDCAYLSIWYLHSGEVKTLNYGNEDVLHSGICIDMDPHHIEQRGDN